MNGNCFDEDSDGDIHGECAAEIHRLQAKVAILRGALDLASTELYCHVDCAHCDVGVEPDILIAVQKALHATTPDHIADSGKKVEPMDGGDGL